MCVYVYAVADSAAVEGPWGGREDWGTAQVWEPRRGWERGDSDHGSLPNSQVCCPTFRIKVPTCLLSLELGAEPEPKSGGQPPSATH